MQTQHHQGASVPSVAQQPSANAPKTLSPNSCWSYCVIKRGFDVIASLFALLVFFPVLLAVASAIKLEDPKGKVFYKAPRGGKNGVAFPCYKFRSMYANADDIKQQLMTQNEMSGPVFKITDDPRITKVGRLIRKTSLDELPQLLNVLKGDMSFVGPRPLPIAEAQAVPPEFRARELVRPGITCIWQVSGRNNIDFEDWMKLDLTYIEKQNLWLDFQLLLKTIPAVLTSRGAS